MQTISQQIFLIEAQSIGNRNICPLNAWRLLSSARIGPINCKDTKHNQKAPEAIKLPFHVQKWEDHVEGDTETANSYQDAGPSSCSSQMDQQ